MRRGLGFLAVAAVGLAIGLAAAALADSPAAHPRTPYARVAHPTCFVAGASCSIHACTEFVAAAPALRCAQYPSPRGMRIFVTR
jgi:hypothetical protein